MDNSEVVKREKEKGSESSLRRWLAPRWGSVWHSYVEPSGGSTIGAADVLVLLPGDDTPTPVELKMADLTRSQQFSLVTRYPLRITPDDLRPLQIKWHDDLARAGGKSCLLMGVLLQSGGYECWVQPRCWHEVLRYWRKGFEINSLTRITGEDGMVNFDKWKVCLDVKPSRPLIPINKAAARLG